MTDRNIRVGDEIYAYGYTFHLEDTCMLVFDFDRQPTPVAIKSVLDDNGHPYINTRQKFEEEIAFWLREWGVV